MKVLNVMSRVIGTFVKVKGDQFRAEELFARAFQAGSNAVRRNMDGAVPFAGITPYRQ